MFEQQNWSTIIAEIKNSLNCEVANSSIMRKAKQFKIKRWHKVNVFFNYTSKKKKDIKS